jgi:hypothetical protein
MGELRRMVVANKPRKKDLEFIHENVCDKRVEVKKEKRAPRRPHIIQRKVPQIKI